MKFDLLTRDVRLTISTFTTRVPDEHPGYALLKSPRIWQLDSRGRIASRVNRDLPHYTRNV